MYNAIAPARLLATCLLFVAPLAVTHQALAADDVSHVVCRSHDMASRTSVYSEPMGYIVVSDRAAEMREMGTAFHADARSRFGLSASTETFCDVFPGESQAQAFIDKDKRQAASSNMTVRGSDWVGDSEGFDDAWELMRFQAVQADGIAEDEAARRPVPGSRVLPAHAGLIAPAGKRWRLFGKQGSGVEVIGLDPDQAGSRQPTAVIANYSRSKSKENLFGDMRYVDYSLTVATFDCDKRGRKKELAKYFYSLEHGLMASNTKERDWSEPFLIPERAWEPVCRQGAGSEPFATQSSHDATLRAYRERADEEERREKKNAVTDDLARRKANIVPQTSLAAATASSHWHVAELNRLFFSVVAAHGVTDGSAPGRKRMSNATFVSRTTAPRNFDRRAEAGLLDFIVQDLEFDCATPRRIRRLGYAMYVVVNGELKVFASEKTPEEWRDHPGQSTDAKAWAWACEGGSESNPLPPGTGFEAMLDSYRERLGVASGQGG